MIEQTNNILLLRIYRQENRKAVWGGTTARSETKDVIANQDQDEAGDELKKKDSPRKR